MRGRLIQPFVAVIYRLDPVATAAVVGGGYSRAFREPVRVPDGTQLGTPSRREQLPIRLRCQIDRTNFDGASLLRAGYQPEHQLQLALHWPELEARGLIDAQGNPLLFPGDRVAAIETIAGAVEATFPNPPGLWVRSCERAGHGLAAFGVPRTNLLILHCAVGRADGEGGVA
jgi:hypothetical protein